MMKELRARMEEHMRMVEEVLSGMDLLLQRQEARLMVLESERGKAVEVLPSPSFEQPDSFGKDVRQIKEELAGLRIYMQRLSVVNDASRSQS